MNNNFCHHPWIGLDIENNGEIKPCCKFHPELENWTPPRIQDGINSYLASDQLKNLKQQFLDNNKPAGCIRCWKDEEANYPSKRQLDFNRWQQQLTTHDLNSNDFLFLTLPLGNHCNLKCRICGPDASTSWIKEHYDLFGEKIKAQNWHKDPKIWNDIIDYSKNSLEIHIHGGEPFLYESTEHIDILKKLVESGNSQSIRLHYSTNASVFPKDEYWKLFENFGWVDIQPSIDDMGKRFDYNRHPATWQTAEQNLLKYRDMIGAADNLQLSISTTVSVFTIYYLEDFFDHILSLGLPKPWLGRLQFPSYYKVGVLPDNAKKKIANKLVNSNHEDLQKISSWLDDDDQQHWDTFLRMIDLHDCYRNESFANTFPELASLIDE